jgi:hypothetical protein
LRARALGRLDEHRRNLRVERARVDVEAAAVLRADVEIADELAVALGKLDPEPRLRNQLRISSSLSSTSPNDASACSSSKARIAGASSGVASRSSMLTRPPRVCREPRQVGQLARRRRSGRLAETVDPDRRQAELIRRRDVVEEARGDVNVRQAADRSSKARQCPSAGL